jgi:hypothetical protein
MLVCFGDARKRDCISEEQTRFARANPPKQFRFSVDWNGEISGDKEWLNQREILKITVQKADGNFVRVGMYYPQSTCK